MRKIEQAMIDAIKAGRDWSKDNTRVSIAGTRGAESVKVFLHGNMIAQRIGHGWKFTLAGWNTPTTRSRINALAYAFSWRWRVSCKAGIPQVVSRSVADNPGWRVIGSHEWVEAN
jgi:hypothetical protein